MKHFRIMKTGLPAELAEQLPDTIPFELVAPYEERAYKNHRQTLTRLSERGGLCPAELVAVLGASRTWRISDADAVARLVEWLRGRAT